MLKKLHHMAAVLVGLLALPGLIAGLWFGACPDGDIKTDYLLHGFLLALNVVFLFFNVLALRTKPEQDKSASLGLIILVNVLMVLPNFLAALFGAIAWMELQGPYAYQYDTGFKFARYTAKDGSFTLQYPQDWEPLTPQEAVEKTRGAVVPSGAAVLFIGNPNSWLENLNIQISNAGVRDQRRLSDAIKPLEKAISKSDPSVRIASSFLENRNGIDYLTIVITKFFQGTVVRQSSTSFVMNGKLVTIVATAPKRVFCGINSNRFEKVIASFGTTGSGGR